MKISEIKEVIRTVKDLVVFLWGYPDEAPNYPVLWCLVRDYEVPFGEKILIDKSEPYQRYLD